MRYLFVATTAFVLALLSSRSAALRAAGLQAGSVSSPPALSAASADGRRALLDQYCVGCHNQRSKTAGLMFDTMDLAHLSKDAEIWEKAVRKLRGGLMPPPGARQPDRASVNSFVSWLETSLDQAAAAAPNPGNVTLHRLNRAEYANTIKDLLSIDVDASALLPADDVSDGFDNIANVLKVSPSYLDQYISAARMVSSLAVGNPPPAEPLRVTLRPESVEQSPRAGGMLLGTQGGMLAEYLFPADGEYELRIGSAGGRGRQAAQVSSETILTIDGVRISQNGRVPVRAGLHKVGISSAATSFVESEALLQSFVPGGGVARAAAATTIQVTGPYTPSGSFVDSPNRKRIFVCRPAPAATASEELSCATQILSSIGRRAFRRSLTERDLAAPIAFYKDGRSTGNFETGIQTGMMAILASPKFLYRVEPAPASLAPGATYKVSDLDLASRLSFFLWSQIPDETLLNLATEKRLSEPAVLEQQVRRMLADPKSKSLVSNFAFQWLKVRDADKIDPDPVLFPSYDQGLRQAFKREMELFVESIMREDRNVTELLTANYTFVNERLAAHYGIPDVRGNQFRRVTVTDSSRRGLLGKGSILLVTSYPNRTAPVLRGAWILENLTGTPPSPPPPDVEGFKENKEGEKPRTVREIMEKHRANATCNACHGVLDPLGFALENFDAIGAWREKDRYARTVIDAAGKLVDGTPVSGPDDLRQALMKRPEQFVQAMTEKLLTYALGRNAEYYDMPTVRKIVREAGRNDYRFSSIVMGIVRSAPFQMQQIQAADSPVAKVE